jgi:hypothetical protein
MDIYDIFFIMFCAAMLCLICIGVSKNILTKYGVGFLLIILSAAIIGYDLWAAYQVKKVPDKIDLAPSGAEK